MKPLLSASLLSCVFALAACAHAGSSTTAGSGAAPAVTADQSFALQPGASVTLPDRSTLRFVAVTADSRCKPGTQCIWAGDAALEFQWTDADGSARTLAFNSANDAVKSAGAWSLELQSLDFADPPNAQLKLSAK